MVVTGSRGPYPYDEGRHLIVALNRYIYADESGTHGTGPFCLIAGYRASPGQWGVFKRDWKTVLNKPEYRIKEFHSSVFFARADIQDKKRNPYLGWSDKKADRFIGELVMIIRHRNIYPVGCAVEIRDFETFTPEIRGLLAGYMIVPEGHKRPRKPAPYHVAFKVLLEDAAFGTHSDTQLHFLFARQKEYQKHADESYHTWKESGPGGLQAREIGWDFPVNWPQLQAADLLAYQWNNFLTRGQLHISRRNQLLMEQLTFKRDNLLVVDAAGIDRIIQRMLGQMYIVQES